MSAYCDIGVRRPLSVPSTVRTVTACPSRSRIQDDVHMLTRPEPPERHVKLVQAPDGHATQRRDDVPDTNARIVARASRVHLDHEGASLGLQVVGERDLRRDRHRDHAQARASRNPST
jgi:hypothetical protein